MHPRGRRTTRYARRFAIPPLPVVSDGAGVVVVTPGTYFSATTVVPAPAVPTVAKGASYKSAFGHRVFYLADGVVASPYHPAFNRDNTKILYDQNGIPKIADVVFGPTSVAVTNERNAFFATGAQGLASDCIWGASAPEANNFFFLDTVNKTSIGQRYLVENAVGVLRDFRADPVFVAAFGDSSGSSGGGGIPFGPYYVPETGIAPLWTGSTKGVSTAGSLGIKKILDAHAAIGAKCVISLWTHSAVVNPDGTFNELMWQAQVKRFLDSGLAPYIAQRVADGTIVAHYIMDEPYWAPSWGGAVIPKATVDRLAQYSKQLYPGLKTAVRAAPDALASFSWVYLDYCWLQYENGFGLTSPTMGNNTQRLADVTAYANRMRGLAQNLGLGIICDLNWTNGGDGQSGIPGTQATGWFMDANELKIYGECLGLIPEAKALMCWQWNLSYVSIYFSLQSIQDAMAYVRDKLSARVAPSPPRSLKNLRANQTRTRFCALVLNANTQTVDGVVAFDRTTSKTWAFLPASNTVAGQSIESVELDAPGSLLKITYAGVETGWETIRLSDNQRSGYVTDTVRPLNDSPGSAITWGAEGIAVYKWPTLHPATAATRVNLYAFALRTAKTNGYATGRSSTVSQLQRVAASLYNSGAMNITSGWVLHSGSIYKVLWSTVTGAQPFRLNPEVVRDGSQLLTQVGSIGALTTGGQWTFDGTYLYVWLTSTLTGPSAANPVIAFDWRHGLEEILLVNIDGTQKGRLCHTHHHMVDSGDGIPWPSESQDGSYIGYTSNMGGGQTRVMVVKTTPES